MRGRVGPSVGPSLSCYFRMTSMVAIEGNKSSNDSINCDTLSNAEVAASDLPRGTCFFFLFSSLIVSPIISPLMTSNGWKLVSPWFAGISILDGSHIHGSKMKGRYIYCS